MVLHFNSNNFRQYICSVRSLFGVLSLSTIEKIAVIMGSVAIPALLWYGDGKRIELKQRNSTKLMYYNYYMSSRTHQDYILLSEYADCVSAKSLDISKIANDFAEKKKIIRNEFKTSLAENRSIEDVQHQSVVTELEWARRRVAVFHNHLYYQLKQDQQWIQNIEERESLFGANCRRLRIYEVAILMSIGGNSVSSSTNEQKIADNEELLKAVKFYRDIGCPNFYNLYSPLSDFVQEQNLQQKG